MKIFIFGAGASLGSQGERPYENSALQAPLINQLFSRPYQDHALNILSGTEFDECQSAVEAEKDKSVEVWLTNKWIVMEAITDQRIKNAEQALFGEIVFYIWNLLRLVSNTYTEQNGYNVFLRKLKQGAKPFGLINFNYDTLLDRALSDVFKADLFTIDGYIKNKYVKPHGSVNWILNKRNEDQDYPSDQMSDIRLRIKMAIRQFFNSPIPLEKLHTYEPSYGTINHPQVETMWSNLGIAYFYPLIFLPLTSKRYQHITYFYERIIGEGKKMLQEADEVYLIGYRASDEIIKEMLRGVKPNTKLNIVGNSNDSVDEIMERVLKFTGNLNQGQKHNEGFWSFAQNYL